MLFVDGGTNRVGIGTQAPSASLHVSSSNNDVAFRVDNLQSSAKGPALFVTGARGDGAAVQCLGIGTETPQQALDVNGYITLGASGGGYVMVNGDADTWIRFGHAGTDSMQFKAGGVNFLEFDENGLDHALFNSASADVNFHVRSAANSASLFVEGDTGRVGIGTSAPGASLHVSSSGDEALLSVDGATNGNVLFVTGSGRVGIGTTSPTHEFEVYPGTDVTAIIGRAFVGYNGFNTNAATFGHRDLQGSAYALYQNAAGMTIVNAHSGEDMYFRINNSTKATLDSNGQFGIGTTTPNSTFQVSGSQAGNYTVISGSMTLNETHYIADLTGAINATVTLPATSGVTGRTYHILTTYSGDKTLTITGSGGQFMGSNQQAGPEDEIGITGSAQSVTLVSTGAYWFILTDNRQQGH
jgi:hypothetical protein